MKTSLSTVQQLMQLQQRPALFEPGEPLFWDDPHISSQMLAAHLNPDTEAASRRPETIERVVAWLVTTLGLTPGQTVLDLGCGPGLYASRLAACGLHVTGVDYSRRSIAYAQEQAANRANPTDGTLTYRYQDYLTLSDVAQYDAALLIYGDYCVLSPVERAQLLQNIHRALREGGRFVLDVTTRVNRQRHGVQNGWYAAEGGFWRPGPHVVLEQGFDYPEPDVCLDQYLVLDVPDTPTDAPLRVTAYHNWFQNFTAETIRAELEAGGFQVEGLWGDLAGAPLEPESEWIGAIARRAAPSGG